MSRGTESKESVKRRNAQPGRSALRSAQGDLWKSNHPDRAQDMNKRSWEKLGYQAQMIRDAFDPLEFESDNALLTCDWHIPLHDERIVDQLLCAAKEHDTRDLVIIGDFWDCDNISKFTSLVTSPQKNTFKGEQDEIEKMLHRLLNVFERIFICAGNHEYRWCALTAGNSEVKDLYKLAFPAAFDGGKYEGRIRITNDDHMILRQNGDPWLLCHPRNFSIVPLSVGQRLAAKHLMNVIVAHGHGFCQGRDRSGKYICLDGGGLYERAALEYARRTSCHPMTRSGFYLLKDGKILPFEGVA